MTEDRIVASGKAFTLDAPTEGSDADLINDYPFMRDLKRLKELRSFLIQEAIGVSPQDTKPLSFGKLNSLRYDVTGRAPTQEEWAEVESQTQTLFRLLTDPLRRKFILGEIPSWIWGLPIALALIALAALIAAIVVQDTGLFGIKSIGASTLPFYLVWLMSLGAIGSVAFIGMNALSVQQDITFDLSNRRLMILRIVLGALFGLVLTLPFGFEEFMKFVVGINRGGLVGGQEVPAQKISGVTTQAMLLLLPFILGFSTSLVIMILNRLVDAVQAFFGRTGATERSQTIAPPTQPPPQTKTAS